MIEYIQRDRLLNAFLRYAAINSPCRGESAIAKVIQPELEELGFSVQYDRAGDAIGGDCGNLIASRKGSITGAVPIAFSAHMDTVIPTENWGYICENDEIRSEGTTVLGADDKAGIAAILEAVRVVDEQAVPCGDLQILLSISEEPGLLGALNMDMSMVTSEFIYVFDVGEPVGKIYLAAPRHAEITAIFTGRGSHAGMCPENGINAICAAGNAIGRMHLGRLDEETTANIGLIIGGSAVNAVPEKCEVRGEARSIDGAKLESQLAHMKACCDAAATEYGANVEVTIREWYGGYQLNPDSSVAKLAQNAVAYAGLPVITGITGGGSDANIFNNYGIPSLPLGIGYRNAHSVRESITVSDMVQTTAIAMGLIISAGIAMSLTR
jgi:tripeptide aminopeptidase